MGRVWTAAKLQKRDADLVLTQGRLSVLELAKELGTVVIRMAPVRAVCADCANGRKALPYGMRFSCFTDRDFHRR